VGALVALVAVAAVSAPAPDTHARKKKVDINAVWGAHYDAGRKAMRAKDFSKAEEELLAAFELADNFDATDPRHRKTLQAVVKLWMIQRAWGAAEPYLEKIVVLEEEAHGPDHPSVGLALSRLGRNYVMLKKYDKALESFRRALKILEKSDGPDGRRVAKVRHNLGETYRRAGQMDKAIALYQAALTQKEAKLGKDDPLVATSLNDLALLYNQAKRFDEAIPLLRRAVALRKPLGPDDHVLGRTLQNLGDALGATGKLDEAEKAYLEALRIAQAQKPVDRPGIGTTGNALGNLYQLRKRFPEAERYYRMALEARLNEFSARDPRVTRVRKNLATLLERMGKTAEAEALRAKIR